MSLPTTSCPSFQSIFDSALEGYTKQTGIELSKHPTALKIQNCHSPEDVIQLLLERGSEFKDYRDKFRKLLDCIRPVVQVVHVFSGVLGESFGIAPVSSRILYDNALLIIPPYRAHSNPRKRYVSALMFSSLFVALIFSIAGGFRALSDTYPRQTAVGVTASYDAIIDLFEWVANFLRRLHIYTEKIPLSSSMSDIMVKIMIEVLSVLALATNQIKQGRFSTWPLPAYSPFLNIVQRNSRRCYWGRETLRLSCRDWTDLRRRKLG
jgi:hypothetical protein